MNIKNNYLVGLILSVILMFAGFLRIYKIDQIPPSIFWDEAAVGYNAYTIGNWGKDEWGNTFPAFFKSFEDDKHPVHIYLTVLPVKIFGLSEFGIRISAAFFGILNVLLLFLLGRKLFKRDVVGLISAFVLAISPYSIQFSRFNHELNYAVFFLMLGIYLFYKGLEKRAWLPVSFLSFGITLLTYHSAKVVVPPLLLLLVILYFRKLLSHKKAFLLGIILFLLPCLVILFNPELLGTARANQTALSKDSIQKTQLYQKTQNELLGRLNLTFDQYLMHFSPKYLFESGDENARHSSQGIGEFYKIEALFLIIGLITLIWMRSKISVVLIAWALLGPLPASMVGGAPHAARAMFTTGSWHLIIALGIYQVIYLLRNKYLRIVCASLLLILYGYFLKDYLNYYFNEYPKKYAIEWQYGMKQIGAYIGSHNGYSRVYMTDARSQPYIFLLFYLKTPLPEFLETVSYNTSSSRPSNLVASFKDYQFAYFDPLQVMPDPGVLYVVTPSQYDGLAHKDVFDVKKRIKYPNGNDAFFLVSYP